MKIRKLKCAVVLSAGLSALLLLSSTGQLMADENQAHTNPIVESFAVSEAMRNVRVSPDGSQLAYMRAGTKKGDYLIEIRKVSDLGGKPVLLGSDRMEITSFLWLNNKKLLVSFRQQVKDGARTYWASKRGIVNSNGKGRWEVEDFNFGILDLLPEEENNILITYDNNDNNIPDVVKYNIKTGSTKTVMRGSEKVSGGFVADEQGEIRAGSGFDPATSSILQYARLSVDDDWKLIHTQSPENRESFDFIGFVKGKPDEIYVNANMGKDTKGIYIYNIRTDEAQELFSVSVDAGQVMLSNKPGDRGRLLGFTYTGKHPTRSYIDEYEASIYDAMTNIFPGKFVSMASRSDDDNVMVINTRGEDDPGTYYLMLNKQDISMLGEVNPLINKELLGSVKYIKYEARDGLSIPAYVTIPSVGEKPYPTIVMPHGGPWVRDVNVFDDWSQMLASHGYLVIQPQYRGSNGFGMELWTKGDKNWGLTMQDDKDDGAKWLVEKGLADPDRLAMFGWSYGGYAAFASSMRENNIYQCSIAGAGVSDLNRINSGLSGNRYLRILQKPTIAGVSPLQQVEKVNVPILVVHGDLDTTVPVEHSRLFVDELQKHGKQYKYVELEGAGHTFAELFYNHRAEFYGELIDYLDQTCFPERTASVN